VLQALPDAMRRRGRVSPTAKFHDRKKQTMPSTTKDFLALLKARHVFHQCTDETALSAAFAKGVVTGYVGYDCTASSAHVGNLVTMMMLRRLQQCGGRPIVVIGGGTTKVGDPSGKDETRQLLSNEKIAANMASIKQAFARVLRFDESPTGATMINNADWLDRLEYIPFLQEVGRHFTINRMLTFDSVKTRLDREQPLTFLEFNYMIMQAYDFLELSKRHDCVLQMGGSDQWGNIVNGIELTRRVQGRELYGVTCPLLTTSSGAKMGKSVAGAVWLNADMLPDFDFWQYWRNVEDADVGRFLRVFTDMPEDEVQRLERLGGAEINEAKKVLATEITAMVRGRDAAEKALGAAASAFGGGGSLEGLPTVEIARGDLAEGLGVLVAFVKAGLAPTNSEARRQVQSAANSVNDVTVTDPNAKLTLADVAGHGAIKLSMGKKRHVLLRPV
jgi:tyrosyl-tRNA synthetase